MQLIEMIATKCRVEHGTKKWPMKLKSTSWGENYDSLTAFAVRKIKREYGTEFYLEIDGNPIRSKKSFSSLMKNKQGESNIRFIAKV